MRTRSVLALVMGYPLLGGCVLGPSLQYTAFSDGGGPLQPDYSGLTKFTLARSLLVVQASKGQATTVTSVPAEARGNGMDFGIRQVPDTGAEALQVTKVGNSNLVRSLALRPTAGGEAVPVVEPPGAPLPAAAADSNSLALALDVQALLDSPRASSTSLAGIAQGNGKELAFTIAFDPVPTDAIETRTLDLQRTGNLYFYSACRTATLTFISPPLTQQRFTLTVADPNFVQTVAVAPGRTIASHSACGVDVLAGGSAGSGGSALARQVASAQSLSASWATLPMADGASALAALKPVEAAKPARRKITAAPARQPEPVQAQAQAEAAAPAQAPGSPLRNAEIRLPNPPVRESFAF